MSEYQLSPQAIEDLFDIWCYIADDSPRAADSVEEAILKACAMLANSPLAGRSRGDLTDLPVRFWFVTPYPNYVVVYDPATMPLQIVRILHSARNISFVLR